MKNIHVIAKVAANTCASNIVNLVRGGKHEGLLMGLIIPMRAFGIQKIHFHYTFNITFKFVYLI